MRAMPSLIMLGAAVGGLLLAGCQALVPKRDLADVRIESDPALAAIATVGNLGHTERDGPAGAGHLFITGTVLYPKSRCDILSIKGQFVDAEGKVLFPMAGAVSVYEKGSTRAFRLLPQGTEKQKAHMTSAPIARGVVTAVSCASLNQFRH